MSQYSKGKSDQLDFDLKYRFIIDKTGKVSGARIVKASQSDEINKAMEKILSQIPDWTPAKRGNMDVSVLYDEIWMKKAKNSNIRMLIPTPPPPPLIIDIQKNGIYVEKKLCSLDDLSKKIDNWKKNYHLKVVWIKANSEVSRERIFEVKKIVNDKEMSVLDMTQTESNN